MARRIQAVEREEISQQQHKKLKIIDYAPGVVETEMQAQIRANDPKSFPRLQRFVDLHRDGELLNAKVPAEALCRYLNIEQFEDMDDLLITRFGP